MHIIIEGPDGAGKTTLARQLQRASLRPLGYHHEGPPPAGVAPLSHYADLLNSRAEPTIFDRLHLGEAVYPRLLRGQRGLSPTALILLRRVINGVGAQVVVCLPPLEVCIDRWAERAQRGGELLKTEAQLRESYIAFHDLAESQADVRIFTVNGANNEVIRQLLERGPACPFGAIGSPQAKVLVVGERVNGLPDLPFMSESGSSAFLNWALAAAGFYESELAFTNAYTARGVDRDISRIASQLPNLCVILALGREAEMVAQRSGCVPPTVPVMGVPHPSYWKRFHAPEAEAYPALLAQARLW